MNNRKGQPQRRGVNYERKKARDHGAKHIGGPGNPDAEKGRQKLEIKDWKQPVPRPEVVKARRKGVTKFISKSGFTEPALEYGEERKIKLYKGKKRLT
ncbi:MAG: hypothetical protein A3J30_01220 [Candidatus Wildermuthbacteria bacterium RIFCSPLOWO2_02_FULL_47_9c]|uniref:Uncharacterized protein n=2 Tax=Parcubacteria group TaxID=1794811 RepID=A0A837IPK0_9BACT|nr:MAG: hypothetical protein UY25_C0001G0122 [Candidatus Yanofskybacteria bacterium GW2011_GWC1_48_11]KKW03903.1 MAG: hypothetical protein UY38_C0002G0057 [Parcubacteria group bacterium GW2011_GWB1_49_12]KKW08535.1 MAG: hypothetical protein UY45_C0006G0021 [Parcubacteria group bacterium GW2011_GWA1_49_26]KKW14011.1 MAG: hypothetical protein UY53_C0004G0062 [Parcubacteria group bacterium GW2011_GWA2_50_10]OHA61256.1 MAG: hypothetical protein A2109_03200 [Candidatus Wildermuthbacteria bacterium G